MAKTTSKTEQRVLSHWQRFPSRFILDGWLKHGSTRKVSRAALPLLVVLYGQLFEFNWEFDPEMVANECDPDLNALMTATSANRVAVQDWLRRLVGEGFLTRKMKTVTFIDPTTRAWPPDRFAMLPASHVVKQLPKLAELGKKSDQALGDLVAMYLVLIARRNAATQEIWWSKAPMGELAGVDPKTAASLLATLLKADLLERDRLRAWVYKLKGFEIVIAPPKGAA